MTDALEHVAARYADDQTSTEELVRLASVRLSQRLQRSGAECPVCGRRFVPERGDRTTCSDACRQKKFRDKG